MFMSHMHIHKPELIPVTNSGKVMSKTNTMNKLQVRIVYIKVKKEVVGVTPSARWSGLWTESGCAK